MAYSFKGHTVVITGAGGGLGKAYSLLFARRGANVVVNDFNGTAAQKVVDEIIKDGGKAVANTSSVTDGAEIIKSALVAFGGVTILINNAGILRDKGFKNMTDTDFDSLIAVHLKGSFACTKAAWPIFRKQKFGRIINTSSAAGLYGNFGQANYSAAKMGLVAFSKSLAFEGAKYNIRCTAIAPMAASAMTETVLPAEILAQLKPEYVASFVLSLTHPDGPDANGRVFEVGAGYVSEVRWERSKGVVFKVDETYTPSAIKGKLDEITNFAACDHPKTATDADMQSVMERSLSSPSNKQCSPPIRYDGKTVIITGAGAGLGRAYALMYGKLGANVVINDISEKDAKSVVGEVENVGGRAATAVCSAEDGDAIVKVALDKFGSAHVLVANAGILRDKSFLAMTEAEWDQVMNVHLRGTYKCVKAVWPIFLKQKYGRIVTTCSPVGVHGNFGQTNYSTAKAAIMGFTKTLALEGQRFNILANVIVPTAGTAMTKTVWPQEMVDRFKPDYVAPLVGYLTSGESTDQTGGVFESWAGWVGQYRWQRARGYCFPPGTIPNPEDYGAKFSTYTNFDDGRATHPSSAAEATQQMLAAVDDAKNSKSKL